MPARKSVGRKEMRKAVNKWLARRPSRSRRKPKVSIW